MSYVRSQVWEHGDDAACLKQAEQNPNAPSEVFDDITMTSASKYSQSHTLSYYDFRCRY